MRRCAKRTKNKNKLFFFPVSARGSMNSEAAMMPFDVFFKFHARLFCTLLRFLSGFSQPCILCRRYALEAGESHDRFRV